MFSYLWLYFVGFISIYKPYKIREGFVGTRPYNRNRSQIATS